MHTSGAPVPDMPSTLMDVLWQDVTTKTKSIALSCVFGPLHEEGMTHALQTITKLSGEDGAAVMRGYIERMRAAREPEDIRDPARPREDGRPVQPANDPPKKLKVRLGMKIRCDNDHFNGFFEKDIEEGKDITRDAMNLFAEPSLDDGRAFVCSTCGVAYCVVPGLPKCGIQPLLRPAMGLQGNTLWRGRVRSPNFSRRSRRGELRGLLVRTALAGWIRLSGMWRRPRGRAEEPGVHLRMLRLRPPDFHHGGHGDAPHKASVDGMVLGRAFDVDTFKRHVGAATGGSTRPHLQDGLAAGAEAAAIDGRPRPGTSRRGG